MWEMGGRLSLPTPVGRGLEQSVRFGGCWGEGEELERSGGELRGASKVGWALAVQKGGGDGLV